jgi:hypothetical protein
VNFFLSKLGSSQFIAAYAPHMALDEHHQIKFWKASERLVEDMPFEEKNSLGGRSNGHLRGEECRGYKGFYRVMI